jgi:hypothetical protein|tara:strand:+ start:554 stop:1156 length:603 start_codon:yes stop_codon:yes gene_type:complete
MACELQPTVDVTNIEIHDYDPDFVELRVRANIEGLQTYLDSDIGGEDMTQYVNAVMLFSIHDPETVKNTIELGDTTTTVETQLNNKGHWEGLGWMDFDSYTYGESVSIDYDRAEFIILVPKELRWEDTSPDGVRTQGKVVVDDYLSYFTYIQVNTKQMNEDYSTDIPSKYSGITTEYITAKVLQSEELGDNVIDYRDSGE